MDFFVPPLGTEASGCVCVSSCVVSVWASDRVTVKASKAEEKFSISVHLAVNVQHRLQFEVPTSGLAFCELE